MIIYHNRDISVAYLHWLNYENPELPYYIREVSKPHDYGYDYV